MPIAEDSAGGSPVPIPTNLTTNLTGEATGSGTLDYTTGDIDIAVTVVDNGHNHILSNITDVQVNNAISGQILVYNGTVWANATNTSGITAIVQDLTPQLGGNLDLNGKNINGNGNINLADNYKLTLGTGNDLEISHDGVSSYIRDVGAGDLQIFASDDVYIRGQGSNTYMARFNESGAVTLYHNNVVRLITTDSGITVTDEVEAVEFIGPLRGPTKFKGQAGEALSAGDPVYISGISGNITVVSKADANDASKMPAFGIIDASVSANASCQVLTFGEMHNLDTSAFSEGDELYVSNTGTLTTTIPSGESSQIQKIAKVTRSHASVGSIFIMGAGRSNAVPNLDNGDIFIGDGTNHATTTSLNTAVNALTLTNYLPLSGGAMTGNITTSGTFDGRNVSVDGAKLDGIEAGADVTLNEISAGTNVTISAGGVISSTASGGLAHVVDDTTPELGGNLSLNSHDITGTGNLNFTGNVTLSGTVDGRDVASDGTKLDGIEASADVTDTANVTAAGALMDSEVTNLAQVKAFDSSDYATSAQGTTADAALPKAGGTMTGDILFNDSVKAKYGTSSDLQIYHDASHSYIKDSGTGNLKLETTGGNISLLGGTENMVVATKDGSVSAYYDGNKKLETSATGIDVTGNILSNTGRLGLGTTNPAHEIHIESTSPTIRLVDTDGSNALEITQSGSASYLTFDNNMRFRNASAVEKLRIDSDGIDVTGVTKTSGSGYNPANTGWATNASLITSGSYGGGLTMIDGSSGYSMRVQSAGADLVIGQGATSGALTEKVRIQSNGMLVTKATDISMDGSASGQFKVQGSGYGFGIALDADAANIYTNSASRDLVFGVNETEVARVKPAGLDVTGELRTTGSIYLSESGNADSPQVVWQSSGYGDQYIDNYQGNLRVVNSGAQQFTIKQGGNVGVGTSAPTAKMHLFTDGIDQSMFSAQADLGVQNRILTLKSPVSDSSTQPFRWQTSNSILWEIDSTETKSMLLNSAGNLGVGTLSPSYKIDCRGAANTDVAIQVKATGTGDVDAELRLDAADTGESLVRYARNGITRAISEYTNSDEWNFTTYNNDKIDFQPNSTNAFRITDSNVYSYKTFNAQDDIKLPDASQIKIGTGDDLLIYQDGAASIIKHNTTGQVFFMGDDIRFVNQANNNAVMYLSNDIVRFYGNSTRPDGTHSYFGTGNDLDIYHDGSNSWIRDVGTGALFLDTGTSVNLYANGNTHMLQAQAGAGVNLYYAGVSKITTTSAGATLTGNVNVTNALNVGGASTTNTGYIESPVVGSSRALQTVGNVNTTQTHIGFENPSGEIGRIDVSAFSVAYVTSSDYRLKTDIQPMQGSIDRVKALRPVNFEWVNDGGRVDGFIAHEAQEVVPESISGEKDAMRDQQYVESEATGDIYTPAVEATYETIQVELTPAVEATYDEDGNELTPAVDATYEEQQQELTPAIDEVIHSSDVVEPDELEEGQLWRETTEKVMATRQVPDYQGIDQSKIVPLLTSALQDAIAKIEALETRLEALES